MKNFKHWSAALMFGTSLLASSSQAFTLKHLQTEDVADANFCGDYNKLVTYEMQLSKTERLPETEYVLLSKQNLEQLEQEMRQRFYLPKSARGLVLRNIGTEAGAVFAENTDLKSLNHCFQTPFEELFSFTLKKGKFVPSHPGAVTYLRAAFETGEEFSAPFTVVLDRIRGKAYIHLEM
jgi:hypothetical protein